MPTALSYRSVQLGVMLAVLAVTFVLVGVSSFVYARLAVDDLSRQVLEQTAQRVDQRVGQVVDVAAAQAELWDNLIATGAIASDDPEALTEVFYQAIRAEERLSYLSFSTENGDYLHAVRRPEGDLRILTRLHDAEGHNVSHETVIHPDGRRELVFFDPDAAYDPRERPFYTQPRQAGHPVWTETYVFFDEALNPLTTGVTRAVPVYDEAGLVGVLTADFDLLALSQFLGDVPVGRTGFAFLLERRSDGSTRVIAHPDGAVLHQGSTDGLVEAVAVDDIDDPVVFAFAAQLPADLVATDGLIPVQFTKDGVRYVGGYRLLGGDDVPPWVICAVLPASDVMGRVQQMTRVIAAVAVLGLLMSLVLGLYLSRVLARTVGALTDEMHRVARFELSDQRFSDHPTYIRELDAMGAATDTMKQGLRSFGRYIPRELVRRLVRSGEEAVLGADERELTILFSDIAGFTTIVESTPPAVVMRALGEYLGGMNTVIGATGGTVCQYLGDAVMAFWGAPEPQADHAVRACRGALRMKAHAEALLASAGSRGLPQLPTRFGVNSGAVLVGNIGAPERFNYGVLGDAVNLAARLEGLNKQYGSSILVGERTAELVGDRVVLRPVDWVRVKGKGRPILVHELIGMPGEVAPEVLAAVGAYQDALVAYREGAFDRALDGFRAADQALGGDGPSRTLIERCEAYLVDPPGQDWDGVYVMLVK